MYHHVYMCIKNINEIIWLAGRHDLQRPYMAVRAPVVVDRTPVLPLRLQKPIGQLSLSYLGFVPEVHPTAPQSHYPNSGANLAKSWRMIKPK